MELVSDQNCEAAFSKSWISLGALPSKGVYRNDGIEKKKMNILEEVKFYVPCLILEGYLVTILQHTIYVFILQERPTGAASFDEIKQSVYFVFRPGFPSLWRSELHGRYLLSCSVGPAI